MEKVKVGLSMPKKTFDELEEMIRETGFPRSTLIAIAVAEYYKKRGGSNSNGTKK